MEDDLKKNEKQPQKRRPQWKTNTQKNLFSITLKFRGKPFLELAQLSKIFIFIWIIKY